MLAPSPFVTTPVWPSPDDAPALLVIVLDQAGTIAAQGNLIDTYQGHLDVVQNPLPGTPATGTGAVVTNATSVPVSAVTGVIVNGARVDGTGASQPPTVLGLVSGTQGGAGTYLLSGAVTLATATVLTFTPPPPAGAWPIPRDADTLDAIVQVQTAVLRTQAALLQHYQDLLNTSQVAVLPGP